MKKNKNINNIIECEYGDDLKKEELINGTVWNRSKCNSRN